MIFFPDFSQYSKSQSLRIQKDKKIINKERRRCSKQQLFVSIITINNSIIQGNFGLSEN